MTKNAKRRRDAIAALRQRERINLCAGDPRRAYTTRHHGEIASVEKQRKLNVPDADVALARGAGMDATHVREHRAQSWHLGDITVAACPDMAWTRSAQRVAQLRAERPIILG